MLYVDDKCIFSFVAKFVIDQAFISSLVMYGYTANDRHLAHHFLLGMIVYQAMSSAWLISGY